MNTSNRIQMSAPFDPLFNLAADIANWPKILPHYRYVNVLGTPGDGGTSRNGGNCRSSGERNLLIKGDHSLPSPQIPTSRPVPPSQDVVAEMAARHLGLPLWWKTIQRPRPDEKRIYFTHIGGVTKGMEVYWEFEQVGESCNGPTWLVQIHHTFNPPWPVVGPFLAEHVIGRVFVQQVANKTLRRIKEIAERGLRTADCAPAGPDSQSAIRNPKSAMPL